MTTRTIDISPSWHTAMEIYATAAMHGTPEGQASALASLRDAGELLDRLAQAEPELFTKCREGLSI